MASDTLSQFGDLKDIDGNVLDWGQFREKKAVLIVNVASKCGKTKNHYEKMVALQRDFKDVFQIICFPCNQFGYQEPKPNAEIKTFVENLVGKEHGMLMMDKVNVNKEACPLYVWMKKSAGLEEIKWNFGAYFLFDKQLKFVEMLTGVPSKMEDNIAKVVGVSAAGGSAGVTKDKVRKSPMKRVPMKKAAAAPIKTGASKGVKKK